MRRGAAHNASGIPNEHQPGTFYNGSTAVRHTRTARRQHCRGPLRLFRKMLVYLLPACPITHQTLPLLRAHRLLCRRSHILTVQYRRREPVSPAWFPSARVRTISTKGTRASRTFPLGDGPSSMKGTRSQRHSPQPRYEVGNGNTRFKRRPPQPWQGSLRFTRRFP